MAGHMTIRRNQLMVSQQCVLFDDKWARQARSLIVIETCAAERFL